MDFIPLSLQIVGKPYENQIRSCVSNWQARQFGAALVVVFLRLHNSF